VSSCINKRSSTNFLLAADFSLHAKISQDFHC